MVPGAVFFPFGVLFSRSLIRLTRASANRCLLNVINRVTSRCPNRMAEVLNRGLYRVPSFMLTRIRCLILTEVTLFIRCRVTIDVLRLLPGSTTNGVCVIITLKRLHGLIRIVIGRAINFLLGAENVAIRLTFRRTVNDLNVLINTIYLRIFLRLSTTVRLMNDDRIAALRLRGSILNVGRTALERVRVSTNARRFLYGRECVRVVKIVTDGVAAKRLLIRNDHRLLRN